MTEYHECWTANKELADELGYKVGESGRATDRECEDDGIKTSDADYDKKPAEASEVVGEKFLAATFLLGADRRQYGGMMTQLRNDYANGQKTYPATVQKAQALLTEWEGDKYPVHGSDEGLRFDDDNRGAAGKGDAKASGGHASCGGVTKMRRCY